jgi:hypothetical protein
MPAVRKLVRMMNTGNMTAAGDLSVSAGKKIGLEGSAGDTYVRYGPSNNTLWLYLNGQKLAWFKD